jgi:hypothetical protein
VLLKMLPAIQALLAKLAKRKKRGVMLPTGHAQKLGKSLFVISEGWRMTMPNYKSLTQYQQAKAKAESKEAYQERIALAQERVDQLLSLHVQLCRMHGDSGSVRQQLEDADNHLESLKQS